MGILPPQQVATSTLTSGTVYTPARSLTHTGRGADFLAEVRNQDFRLPPCCLLPLWDPVSSPIH